VFLADNLSKKNQKNFSPVASSLFGKGTGKFEIDFTEL
jgi:hypothetical protein